MWDCNFPGTVAAGVRGRAGSAVHVPKCSSIMITSLMLSVCALQNQTWFWTKYFWTWFCDTYSFPPPHWKKEKGERGSLANEPLDESCFASQNIASLDDESSQKSLSFSSRSASNHANPREPQCFLYILAGLSPVKSHFSTTKYLPTEKQMLLLTPLIQTSSKQKSVEVFKLGTREANYINPAGGTLVPVQSHQKAI